MVKEGVIDKETLVIGAYGVLSIGHLPARLETMVNGRYGEDWAGDMTVCMRLR